MVPRWRALIASVFATRRSFAKPLAIGTESLFDLGARPAIRTVTAASPDRIGFNKAEFLITGCARALPNAEAFASGCFDTSRGGRITTCSDSRTFAVVQIVYALIQFAREYLSTVEANAARRIDFSIEGNIREVTIGVALAFDDFPRRHTFAARTIGIAAADFTAIRTPKRRLQRHGLASRILWIATGTDATQRVGCDEAGLAVDEIAIKIEVHTHGTDRNGVCRGSGNLNVTRWHGLSCGVAAWRKSNHSIATVASGDCRQ